jgi:tetratricopeptide (TPR) repeat protein
VQREPTFEHGYALATAYLKLKDPDHATTIFEEMRAGFGDTAVIHMEFGRAFAEAGYPEHGIEEFKKAIAKDDKLAGAHYSLGAAYLVGLADAAFPIASEEFRKELKNHPDDVLSLYQLGYIVLSQHKLNEAEDYLGHAAALDPTNPDMPLSLGQAYAEENRLADAEALLRKSIALTRDVSRNHYQVQRAHYLLGRVLLQTGREDEAKQELKASEQLLKQSVSANQGQAADGGMLNDIAQKVQLRSTESIHAMGPEAMKQVEAYEKQLSLPIADGYNNLGAIAAGRNEFLSAAEYFRHAAFWNPSTEGLDYNWGRAAFSANQYQQAIAPLSRHLQLHPDDTLIRSALGSSLFRVEKYGEAVEILKPLENQINSNPRLDYIYAVSLVKSGAFATGITRLQHTALGEAYARHGDDAMAVHELRIAIELNPADADAKHLLALTLVKLQQHEEVPH